MGLYGMMRTSASGMAAQSNRLGTVADNIANSSTVGYKRGSTEFSSLLLDSGIGEYSSGSVETRIRYGITEQGALRFTTSVTDLAVKGNGFFVVQDQSEQTYLTRAGSFVRDGEGDLVNAAGFKLMGYDLASGSPNAVINSTAGLTPVNVSALALQANPTSEGQMFVNLPSEVAVVAAANLPSANAATAEFAGKTSLIVYDNLGSAVMLDVYSAKSASGSWEVSVFDQAAAAPGGGFPYASGPLATTTLTFDAAGKLTSSSPTSVSFTVPNGAGMTLDMSQTSQVAADYTVLSANANGNAPSGVERIDIANDGTLYAIYQNGSRVATHRIPLADVPSPDNLTPLAGNVYALSAESGDLRVGPAGASGFGTMVSSALEQSTVDLASELTTMIEAERNYTANSKVFQTGAELMDVLVNLKR
jgi:flagellar hook protein FlgE